MKPQNEMALQAECQMRLAVEEFGNGKAVEDMTGDEKNDVMNLWTHTGYSAVWRELVDKMKSESPEGSTMDYSRITLDQVIKNDPKKIYN
ncbi:MAG: hypothetical protein WCO48_02780 [Candidatus Taylorbacteria bacterium]